MLGHLQRPFLVMRTIVFRQPSGSVEEPNAILLSNSPRGSGADDPTLGAFSGVATPEKASLTELLTITRFANTRSRRRRRLEGRTADVQLLYERNGRSASLHHARTFAPHTCKTGNILRSLSSCISFRAARTPLSASIRANPCRIVFLSASSAPGSLRA